MREISQLAGAGMLAGLIGLHIAVWVGYGDDLVVIANIAGICGAFVAVSLKGLLDRG